MQNLNVSLSETVLKRIFIVPGICCDIIEFFCRDENELKFDVVFCRKRHWWSLEEVRVDVAVTERLEIKNILLEPEDHNKTLQPYCCFSEVSSAS